MLGNAADRQGKSLRGTVSSDENYIGIKRNGKWGYGEVGSFQAGRRPATTYKSLLNSKGASLRQEEDHQTGGRTSPKEMERPKVRTTHDPTKTKQFRAEVKGVCV
jgi:hypothetical protein